jgi:hypothetical protein
MEREEVIRAAREAGYELASSYPQVWVKDGFNHNPAAIEPGDCRNWDPGANVVLARVADGCLAGAKLMAQPQGGSCLSIGYSGAAGQETAGQIIKVEVDDQGPYVSSILPVDCAEFAVGRGLKR